MKNASVYVNMKYHLLFLLLIIVITTLYGCMIIPLERFDVDKKPYHFEIVFPHKSHLKKHVITSSFFKNMTSIDLKARNMQSQSPADYALTYINSYTKLSNADKEKINRAMERIKYRLQEFPKLLNTRWNFIKVNDGIENNYPHTLGDVIVINNVTLQKDDEEFSKTLIHEKFHVLQRMFPLNFRELYKNMQFMPIKIQRPLLIRNNPDLDVNIYIHEPSNRIPIQLYHSHSPSSLQDSSTYLIDEYGTKDNTQQVNNIIFGLPTSFYCQLEHPAEISACLLTEIITNDAFVEKEKSNTLVKEATLWLSKYYS